MNLVNSGGGAIAFTTAGVTGALNASIFYNGSSFAYVDPTTKLVRAMNYTTDTGFNGTATGVTAGGATALAAQDTNTIASTGTLSGNQNFRSILITGAGAININGSLSQHWKCIGHPPHGWRLDHHHRQYDVSPAPTSIRSSAPTPAWDSITLTGNIGDNSNSTSTPQTVEKTGAGTLTLNGIGNWRGPTFVNQGTLTLGNAQATLYSQQLNVATGATVNFAWGITTEQFGSLAGGGTINLLNAGSAQVA